MNGPGKVVSEPEPYDLGNCLLQRTTGDFLPAATTRVNWVGWFSVPLSLFFLSI